MQTNDGGALFNGLTLSAGHTMTGFAPNAITNARASSMELTVPSISGTLCGSRTNPVIMYTRSFSLPHRTAPAPRASSEVHRYKRGCPRTKCGRHRSRGGQDSSKHRDFRLRCAFPVRHGSSFPPRFSLQRLFCRCRRSIRAGPRSESLSAWRGLCRPRACRPPRRRAGRSWRTTSR